MRINTVDVDRKVYSIKELEEKADKIKTNYVFKVQ
ncbi:uncharacterized protein Yka (UPF0111/DUF47 family) [Chryseobacterium shigense]|uniref:Uncharacterized protein Yka (UPF0111/DUF47 family) n=1 Tax=Chryseobacterium shigense TaxID=297244 RepID=A0A841N834_9FLAO|nr:uncharacterized protein Yka (UPF0111/DUF47 family) [Chryseobacterium shigense]